MYGSWITDWPTPEEQYEEHRESYDEYLDEAMAEYFEYGGWTPLSYDEYVLQIILGEE